MFSVTLPEFQQGDLILFVHGALADARMWQPHIECLGGVCQGYAVSQRYFGTQGQEHSGEFGINQHAQDLLQWLQALPGDIRVHLVGWSYGADVVLAALTHAPNQVASAFVYDPGYPGCLSKEEMGEFMADAGAMFDPVIPHLEEGRLEQAVAALIDGSGQALGYFQQQPAVLQQQQLDNAHTLVQQMQQAPATDLCAARLSAITVPVTLATGARSRVLFRLVTQSVKPHLAAVRWLQPDANHMWPLEQPTAFVAALHEHLQALAEPWQAQTLSNDTAVLETAAGS